MDEPISKSGTHPPKHTNAPRSRWACPTFAAVLGLVLTAAGVCIELHQLARADQLRFDILAERVRAEIVRRVEVYRYGLVGTRSVFTASKSVERGEFRALVQSRDIPREFPGALGLGYVERVKRADLDAYLTRIREDDAPHFKINTSGADDELYVIEYIEPEAANLSVLGFDVKQESARRAAADRAMLTGEAALSSGLTASDASINSRILQYYLPFYRNGTSPKTEDERREALVGWVYMRLMISKIFADVGAVADGEMDFEVFDGEKLVADAILYDDDEHLASVQGKVTSAHFEARRFSKSVPLYIGGRKWTVMLSTSPKFQPGSYFLAVCIGVAGTLLSGALAGVIYTLGMTAHRARALADSMTGDLQRLAIVAEKTTNAVIIADADQKITWVNNGLTALAGCAPDSPIGKHLDEFLQVERAAHETTIAIRHALSSRTRCRCEILFQSKNAGERAMEIELQALHKDDGTPSGFIVVGTDITEQTTQRNELASIFKAISEGLVVANARGTIVNCNPAAERLLGMPLKEMGTRTEYDKKWRTIHEDGSPWSWNDHPSMVTLRTGKPIQGAVMGIESGGTLRWISINTQPLLGADGMPTMVITSFSDITMRVKSLEELDKKERTLRAMIDQSRQLAGILSTDGRIVDVNQTALKFAGITDRNQIVGKYFWDGPWWSHSMELQEWLRGAVARAARGERIIRETTHPDAAGNIHAIDFSITPVLGADGEVLILIPEGFDITESKQAAEALRKARDAADAATRSKSEFLANMSHEIRTPMTAILGYTDILADEWDKSLAPRQRLEYITTIKNNGEHLLKVINDILDLSKIEAGKMVVESIDANPDQIVHEVLSLMLVKAQAKAISLDAARRTPVPARIRTDPLRLRQILLNLVGNAIKFTEAGSVTILTSFVTDQPGGQVLRFQVVDTGIGMNPDQLQSLFGAFEQGDTSTTRKFGGTGLGLVISKRFAQMLGGDITVTSELGVGSVFTFTLATGPLEGAPLIPAGKSSFVVQENKPPEHVPPHAASLPLRGLRILMVEDGPDNRRLLSYHLRRSGAEVIPAEDGMYAVAALSQDDNPDSPLKPTLPVDLILMDMQMPRMDGYTASRLLRTKGLEIPIIALTAHAMAGDADKCIDAGCDDYVTKPIDQARLISLCERWGADALRAAPRPPVPAPEPSPARVSREEFMKMLTAEFIAELPNHVAKLDAMHAQEQFEEMTDIAHRLAGTAARRFESQCHIKAEREILRESARELIARCRAAIAEAGEKTG